MLKRFLDLATRAQRVRCTLCMPSGYLERLPKLLYA